jgi:hypothetical protein
MMQRVMAFSVDELFILSCGHKEVVMRVSLLAIERVLPILAF